MPDNLRAVGIAAQLAEEDKVWQKFSQDLETLKEE